VGRPHKQNEGGRAEGLRGGGKKRRWGGANVPSNIGMEKKLNGGSTVM